MAHIDDLTHRGALDLAALIRRGDVSSAEVVAAHIHRLRAAQPAVNAVAIPLYEKAMDAAGEADRTRSRGARMGPLHGVPFTVKESFHVAGTDCTAGIDDLVGAPTWRDSALVARLREAGAVLIAKTNVAQLLWFMESDSPLYGRCNNPWDLGRTPGGSSGGEAAAIALGGSALGLGSDIGGSIRIPAHFSGVHGIKPTSGRLTPAEYGSVEERLMPGFEAVLSQAGPMGRTVADLSVALRILFEANPVRPTWREPPTDLRRLRVGLYDDNGHFAASPAIRRALKQSIRALAGKGIDVVPFAPPDVTAMWELYTRLLTADGGACLRRALGGSRRAKQIQMLVMSLMMPGAIRRPAALLVELFGQHHTARALRSCGNVSADAFFLLVAERDRLRARFREAYDAAKLDALICPPLATPALRHGTSVEVSQQQSHVVIFNILGWPAGVVAATRVRPGEESDRPASSDHQETVARRAEEGSAGLPVGVQVAAAPFREDLVLAVMAALEEHFAAEPDAPLAARVPRAP